MPYAEDLTTDFVYVRSTATRSFMSAATVIRLSLAGLTGSDIGATDASLLMRFLSRRQRRQTQPFRRYFRIFRQRRQRACPIRCATLSQASQKDSIARRIVLSSRRAQFCVTRPPCPPSVAGRFDSELGESGCAPSSTPMRRRKTSSPPNHPENKAKTIATIPSTISSPPGEPGCDGFKKQQKAKQKQQ